MFPGGCRCRQYGVSQDAWQELASKEREGEQQAPCRQDIGRSRSFAVFMYIFDGRGRGGGEPRNA